MTTMDLGLNDKRRKMFISWTFPDILSPVSVMV